MNFSTGLEEFTSYIKYGCNFLVVGGALGMFGVGAAMCTMKRVRAARERRQNIDTTTRAAFEREYICLPEHSFEGAADRVVAEEMLKLTVLLENIMPDNRAVHPSAPVSQS